MPSHVPSHDFDRRELLKTAAALAAVTAGGAASAHHRSVAAEADADTLHFFPAGFKHEKVQTSGATINVVRGGDGPPLLLIHGAPQSHVSWHIVAPAVREGSHGHHAGPARLRRQQQVARHAGPRELFEARDGARHGRGDEALRLRLASPSSATTAAAASDSVSRSIIRTRSRTSPCSTSCRRTTSTRT